MAFCRVASNVLLIQGFEGGLLFSLTLFAVFMNGSTLFAVFPNGLLGSDVRRAFGNIRLLEYANISLSDIVIQIHSDISGTPHSIMPFLWRRYFGRNILEEPVGTAADSRTTELFLDGTIPTFFNGMGCCLMKGEDLSELGFGAKPHTCADAASPSRSITGRGLGCWTISNILKDLDLNYGNRIALFGRQQYNLESVTSRRESNFLQLESIPKSDSGVNLDHADQNNESLAANNRQMAKNPSVSSPSMPNLPPIKVRAEDGQMNARFHD
ncbi:hypothetical protein RND71_017279 [Anisodus tanguticus]|uniref:Uncharacterized protein n=1 Tax=Anisodus tanguticus TaxID=243964 RepID=A0AAE1S1Y9_9SOLA|nr:hypothetical protein RND71_017279 [Anisodus tanguticus]